jgi:hypothetical protein
MKFKITPARILIALAALWTLLHIASLVIDVIKNNNKPYVPNNIKASSS